MRIAVIGMGNVGGVLGRRWAEAGHQVTFCVRDPDNLRLRAARGHALAHPPRRQARDTRSRAAGNGPSYSTIICPFMTIQWPGNVQR